MTDPQVTVLMAVRDGAPFIGAAIESVLAQSFESFELLIIDDGSTDDTATIVRACADPRLRFLQNEKNLGLTATLNRGLREARGDLIARQDADDLSHPARLAKQVEFLRTHPPFALIGAQAWLIDGRGRRFGRKDVPLEETSVRWASLFLNPLLHSAVLFRRNVFLGELGGYDETYTCCQDYELWTRALSRFPACNLPDRLVSLRLHQSSVSATRQETAQRLSQQVVERELAHRGQGDAFTSAQVELLTRLRAGIEPVELDAVQAMLEALKSVHDSPDLRRTRALIHADLGYRLLAKDRRAGWRALARAVTESPSFACGLPWAKIAVLTLLGDGARRLFAAIRG